jgi:hypothetical protein
LKSTEAIAIKEGNIAGAKCYGNLLKYTEAYVISINSRLRKTYALLVINQSLGFSVELLLHYL